MQNFIIQTGLASRLSKEIDKSQKDRPFPISKNLSSVRNLTNLYKDIKKKLKNKLKKSFSSQAVIQTSSSTAARSEKIPVVAAGDECLEEFDTPPRHPREAQI